MKFKFQDNVMAVDNGKLYKAKVLKSQNIGSNCKYFIHFQGWAKKFDVWIDEQLLAHVDDLVRIASLTENPSGTTANKTSKSKKGSKEVVSEPLPDKSENDSNDVEVEIAYEARPIKRKVENLDQAASDALKKQRKILHQSDLVDNEDDEYYRKVAIPLNLKKQLVDEYGLITNEPKRLLRLPRAVTVVQVMEDFLEEKIGSKQEKSKEEVSCSWQRNLWFLSVYRVKSSKSFSSACKLTSTR